MKEAGIIGELVMQRRNQTLLTVSAAVGKSVFRLTLPLGQDAKRGFQFTIFLLPGG